MNRWSPTIIKSLDIYNDLMKKAEFLHSIFRLSRKYEKSFLDDEKSWKDLNIITKEYWALLVYNAQITK